VPRYAIGAFGAATGNMLDAMGLICSDGSRTAPVGQTAQKQDAAWEFVCPGWKFCRDANQTWDEVSKGPLCVAWAARGECAKNPSYMHDQCMRSCNQCPPAPPPPKEPLGIGHLDVRGGWFVDALRFHCAPAEVDDEADAVEADPEEADDPEDTADAPRMSDWFGGDGGDECPLSCSGGGDYRSGGLVEGLLVGGGGRVDRIELAKCTGDLDI